MATRHQFHSLAFYNEFYQHINVEHQTAFLLDTVKPLFVGVALNRPSGDFTEEDRLTLNVLRPHLMPSYRNADVFTRSRREIALLTAGIEQTGRAIVFLSPEGAVLRATTMAILAGPGAVPADGSPDTLDRWLRQETRKTAR